MSFFSWISSLLGMSATNQFIGTKGRITSYGYPSDSTPDRYSEAAIGSFTQHLQDGVSLAISRDIEAQFRAAGIGPRAAVEIQLANGKTLPLRWDDRTAASYNGKPLTGRFDLYCQHAPSPLVDSVVIGFRKG